MSRIVVMVLGLMVWSAPIVQGAQYLTVNDEDVKSIMLELGQSCTVEVVSDDSTSYTAYLGFDNGVVLGNFSYMAKSSKAGDLADTTEHDLPAFYGYYLVANGLTVKPSPGEHFIFVYQVKQIGGTTLKLYDETFSSVIDSVDIKVVAATMGTAFSYQGRLMGESDPADGEYDFEFELYDAPSSGNQLGDTFDVSDVDVIYGQFAVELDFGSGIFDGDRVWLEISVRPGDSNGNFTTLAPRQTMMPTPYALHAASIPVPLELAGPRGNPIISATNTGTGTGVYGEGTGQSSRGVLGKTSGKYGIGVQGTATGENSYGVYGFTSGSSGRGVYGMANNSGDVENYGGYFSAAGEDGRGVYGMASNNGDVENYGGYFVAHGDWGRGVYGNAVATSASNYGGYFETIGSSGTGVYGEASNTGDYSNYGGSFKARGQMGKGVYGIATGSKGIGVIGSATGSSGVGVFGSGKAYDFYAGGTGTNYGSASSVRWKRDIRAIDEPLGKILRLRGVYFNWDAEHGGEHDVGMIAEEVGEVLPEIVNYEENGIDATGMDYSKLTPLLVEAVKVLKTQIDELQNENVELRDRLAKLETAASKLPRF